MSKYLGPLVFTAIALLAAAGFGFAYITDRISLSTLGLLCAFTLMLGVVASIFVKKMTHPGVSVEQMLYRTDHPAPK